MPATVSLRSLTRLAGGLVPLLLCIAPVAHAETIQTRIHGGWQPVLTCDGCNPRGLWEGSDPKNLHGESILIDGLVPGEQLRFGGLGGSVLDGGQRVDCIAGDRDSVRIPSRTPLLQFVDENGHVVALPEDGYAGTHSLRVVDLLRTGAVVPDGAQALWGSWPDDDYGNNDDLCYFTITRETEGGDQLEPTKQASSSSTSSVPMSQRESERREHVQNRANTSSRAKLMERITTGPAGVSGNGQSVLDALSAADSRLLCSVQNRFLRPAALTITRVRLTERLAARFSVAPVTLVPALQEQSSCAEFLPVESDAPIGGPAETPSSPAAPDPSPVTPRSPAHSRPRTPSGTPATPSAPSAPSSVGSSEDGLTLEAKLRMLCRVQERGMQDPMGFRDQVASIAQRFADRWNMSAPAITAALLSSTLCSQPSTISLDGPHTPEEVDGMHAGSSIVGTPSGDEDDVTGSDNALMSALRNLPPMVLIVAALATITFLTLVALLLVPLFKRE